MDRNFDKFNFDTDNSLLIVIDVQDKLMKAMSKKDDVIKNSRILVEAMEILKVPTIFTTQYSKGLGSVNESILEKASDPKIFDKSSFTIFDGDIKEEITKLNRKNIIISGAETHICVMQSARDLVASGYNIAIVKNAVSSRTEENRVAGLEYLKDMGATIITTEMILFDLLKTSSRPEFKPVQALIK